MAAASATGGGGHEWCPRCSGLREHSAGHVDRRAKSAMPNRASEMILVCHYSTCSRLVKAGPPLKRVFTLHSYCELLLQKAACTQLVFVWGYQLSINF